MNRTEHNQNPSDNAMAASWHQSLDDAIYRADDTRMWEIVQAQSDQQEAHEAMATLIPRLAYKIGQKVRFNEMFLMPIVTAGGSNAIGNDDLWQQASYAVSEAISTWVGKGTFKTVFNGVRPFDWVSTWRPQVIRAHLEKTLPGAQQKRLVTLTEDIVCPENAPKLGFICMVLTSEQGWPTLPAASTARDDRLKQVVRFALMDSYEQGPLVLTPDRIQFSIPDAVGVWLMRLHEDVGLTGWSATPIASSPDVVKITLRLDSTEVPWTQFTLRKHQISLTGLDDVLTILASIAPFVDAPNDMPAPTTRHVFDGLT